MTQPITNSFSSFQPFSNSATISALTSPSSPQSADRLSSSSSSFLNSCLSPVKNALYALYQKITSLIKRLWSSCFATTSTSSSPPPQTTASTSSQVASTTTLNPSSSTQATATTSNSLSSEQIQGIRRIGSIEIVPSQFPHHINNPNKLFAYNHLTQGCSLDTPITFSKYSLDMPASNAIKNQAVFSQPARPIIECAGVFTYDTSNEQTKHWTVNFADAHLFGFCEGPLLAQDELQVLEHPAIYHLKSALASHNDLNRIGTREIALVENVHRLGQLYTEIPLSSGRTLYGNYFCSASQTEILSRLTRTQPPAHPSFIVAMAAPNVSGYASLNSTGTPYQKRHIEELFYTAYTAFAAIKERSLTAETVLHTGKWGAGAFGNDKKLVALLQIVAARLAGIDEMRYYPLRDPLSLQEARNLFTQIERETPSLTVDQFLTHLTENAERYQFFYRRGNGT